MNFLKKDFQGNISVICKSFSIEKENEKYYIQKNIKDIEFDLNSIAKGYAVDRIKDIFISQKIPSYLIEIGSEVCVGTK